jgi:hypothetical protein
MSINITLCRRAAWIAIIAAVISVALTSALIMPSHQAAVSTTSARSVSNAAAVGTPVHNDVTTPQSAELDFFLSCDVQCGTANNGGFHFWVIASYLKISEAATMATLDGACVAYLTLGSLGFGWEAAVATCSTLVWILETVALNEPKVSNHGVWAAIYFGKKAVQHGTY